MAVHNGDRIVITITHYKFSKRDKWSKWNEINKNIKRKAGEKPDSWLVNREKILGIVS